MITVIARLIVAKSRSKKGYPIYRYHTLKLFSDEGILRSIPTLRITNRANRDLAKARQDYESCVIAMLEPIKRLTIFYVSHTTVVN